MTFTFTPIGIIHSCFKEKFGIPRQAGLVPAARATLELLPPYDRSEAFKGLAGFSHLWLIFIFHAVDKKGWKPTVRPPRLGGNQRLGVFATRSPFRPNPIGLSAVALEKINSQEGKVTLQLKGVDLLDGTPVIDIKPYLPYADALPTAKGGFASQTPVPTISVTFSPHALARCTEFEKTLYPGLQDLISQVLQNDPRPAYYAHQPAPKRTFGLKLLNLDIKWEMAGDEALVTDLEPLA